MKARGDEGCQGFREVLKVFGVTPVAPGRHHGGTCERCCRPSSVTEYYKRAWDERVAPRYRSGQPAPGMSRERFLRLLDAAEYLAAHIHEAPVWIVACLEGGTPTRTSGSSIYPAVQNMLLAARALGLGATLTTLYLQFEKEAETPFGLPPGVHSYA
jgi:nitroreductase